MILLLGTAAHASYILLADKTDPSADQGHEAYGGGRLPLQGQKVSSDELGQLTEDFNQMANALEDTNIKLEEEIRAREDFVGAFAHELKTPSYSAIIGYADALRSPQAG